MIFHLILEAKQHNNRRFRYIASGGRFEPLQIANRSYPCSKAKLLIWLKAQPACDKQPFYESLHRRGCMSTGQWQGLRTEHFGILEDVLTLWKAFNELINSRFNEPKSALMPPNTRLRIGLGILRKKEAEPADDLSVPWAALDSIDEIGDPEGALRCRRNFGLGRHLRCLDRCRGDGGCYR